MIRAGRPSPIRGFHVLLEGDQISHGLVWTGDPGLISDRSLRYYAKPYEDGVEARIKMKSSECYERHVLACAELRRREDMES